MPEEKRIDPEKCRGPEIINREPCCPLSRECGTPIRYRKNPKKIDCPYLNSERISSRQLQEGFALEETYFHCRKPITIGPPPVTDEDIEFHNRRVNPKSALEQADTIN
jgi:hypothetical protein